MSAQPHALDPSSEQPHGIKARRVHFLARDRHPSHEGSTERALASLAVSPAASAYR